jgi:hypothetical protein
MLVFLSVGNRLVFPAVAILTPLSTLILAVMTDSVLSTLAPERFRDLCGRTLVTILIIQAGMSLLTFSIVLPYRQRTKICHIRSEEKVGVSVSDPRETRL